MSVPLPTTPLPPAALKAALQHHLFPETDGEPLRPYAVLDGASIPGLLDHLYAKPQPEFVCLYRGELKPDIAEVAPYLVRLAPRHPFTEWLLTEAWGQHWGIFAHCPAGLKAVRTHFRKFLKVKDPQGQQLYFRFYDPRVLPVFLPTCNAEELQALFGPLQSYLCEAGEPNTLLRFTCQGGKLITKQVPLVPKP